MRKFYCLLEPDPSEQNGAILPARDFSLGPARSKVLSYIINPFIDQACSVKMAGCWPGSFLRVYGPRLRLRVYDLTLGQ